MTQSTYNGWTNYATWRVNLELIDSIDPRDIMADGMDVADLADYFREYTEDVLSCTGEGLALDYARAFISCVDWREIARHKLAEYELAA